MNYKLNGANVEISHICCMSPPLLIFVQPMIRLWNMIHVPRFFSYPMPLLPPIPPAPMSNDTFCKLTVLPLCSGHESLSHKHTAVGRVHLQLIYLCKFAHPKRADEDNNYAHKSGVWVYTTPKGFKSVPSHFKLKAAFLKSIYWELCFFLEWQQFQQLHNDWRLVKVRNQTKSSFNS